MDIDKGGTVCVTIAISSYSVLVTLLMILLASFMRIMVYLAGCDRIFAILSIVVLK